MNYKIWFFFFFFFKQRIIKSGCYQLKVDNSSIIQLFGTVINKPKNFVACFIFLDCQIYTQSCSLNAVSYSCKIVYKILILIFIFNNKFTLVVIIYLFIFLISNEKKTIQIVKSKTERHLSTRNECRLLRSPLKDQTTTDLEDTVRIVLFVSIS
jgi:hypothetical protein